MSTLEPSEGTAARGGRPVRTNPLPAPGSTDQWVQRVVLLDDVKDEIASFEADPIDFLRRRKIPLYVRLDTASHIAYVYKRVGDFIAVTFDPSLSFFKLSAKNIADLQRTNFFANCIKFEHGGLVEADGDEVIAPGYWRVPFITGYVVSKAERLDFERNSTFNDGRPEWSEQAVDLPISLGNVYLEEIDLLAIRREHLPALMEFPERFNEVGHAIRLMYRAAYELNVENKLKEDVLMRLSIDGGSVFKVKRLEEASKFIKQKVRRTAGGSKDRPADGKISFGTLEERALGGKKFLFQEFISPGLRALIVAATWWSHYSKEPDAEFGPHVLKACLHQMGFSRTELPHLVTIIVGHTKWRNVGMAAWLDQSFASGRLARYP